MKSNNLLISLSAICFLSFFNYSSFALTEKDKTKFIEMMNKKAEESLKDKDYDDYYALMGRLASLKGDNQESIKNYEKIKNKEYIDFIGVISSYLILKDVSNAELVFKKNEKFISKDDKILIKGFISEKKEDIKSAKDNYQSFCKLEATSPINSMICPKVKSGETKGIFKHFMAEMISLRDNNIEKMLGVNKMKIHNMNKIK